MESFPLSPYTTRRSFRGKPEIRPQAFHRPAIQRPVPRPVRRPDPQTVKYTRYPWRISKEKRMTLCAAAIAGRLHRHDSRSVTPAAIAGVTRSV